MTRFPYNIDGGIEPILRFYFKKWWHPDTQRLTKVHGWLDRLASGENVAFVFFSSKAKVWIQVIQRAGIRTIAASVGSNHIFYLTHSSQLPQILELMFADVFTTQHQKRRVPKVSRANQLGLDLRYPQ